MIDVNLVSYCGVYCGLCKKFKKGDCPGCLKKETPKWCHVKPCNEEKGIRSCAECDEFSDVKQCKKIYPPQYKFGEFITQVSRKGGLDMIKEKGYEEFSRFMVNENKLLCMKYKHITKPKV